MSTLPDTASDALFARVAAILEQARARAVRAVHNEMVLVLAAQQPGDRRSPTRRMPAALLTRPLSRRRVMDGRWT